MYKEHWKTVRRGKKVHALLDVSIGTGSITFPLSDLGVSFCGSDLSEKMLEKCSSKLTDKKIESLNDLGYCSVQIMNFPAQYQVENMEDADWITIIAKKA